MKRIYLFLVAAMAAVCVSAESSDLFTPYKSTDLRLPSVPLIVNDPYISIWSPYDELNEGTTKHWTDYEKALDGILRVDGTTYRFMGVETTYILSSLLPMADEGAWSAQVTYTTPDDDWADPDYDDSSWSTENGAFGTGDEYDNVYTQWEDTDADLYVRRWVTLDADQIAADLYIVYSHDDVFELYINGTQVVDTGETWLEGEVLHLTDDLKALLVEGDNMIAAHCHNTTGGALLDYGLYENLKTELANSELAEQLSVDVMPTSTYYTFSCGAVELDVVFTAPMLMDDLDLISTPINYISYQVRSTDGAEHDVQFYFGTTPQLAINDDSQATMSRVTTKDGVKYLYTGTVSQNILGTSGDFVCIDWGYLYLPAFNGDVSLASSLTMESTFASTGALPTSSTYIRSSGTTDRPTLAYVHDFGMVDTASSFMMIGYDEKKDIQYMGNNYPGYWARDGKTIYEAFTELYENYDDIMARCYEQDKIIYDDGLAAGNTKYAELLCASYRHVFAAHKLFMGEDTEGNDILLFFSKENNSNGCVNTVDLTYPSSPLFLLYNPDLLKGMMTSIFEYSYSGRWTSPFAAHDIGTYPLANGQVYGGDMPLEESGNMITLAAMICQLENSTDYVEKYWDVITTWADYLVEYGQDPADQLCTDDFAGHWAHNANLSVKAIMGIAGYAIMAQMRGDEDTYTTYMETAKAMAKEWVNLDREDDHYRLAYDRESTWSQKYNMVWDKLWNIHIFPGKVTEREIQYYLTKQNTYGLPLDSRENYTKSDWIMWMSSMSPDTDTFLQFSDLVYKYVNETSSRVPLSDWYYTSSGSMVAFRARSVIGGHWMKVLMDKIGTLSPEDTSWAPAGNKLKTDYADDVTTDNVLPEYPRPLMERADWQSLNGLWEYGFTSSSSTSEPSLYDGEILVPFPLESSLSGVMVDMLDDHALWYKTTFTVPSDWEGKNVLLNFGAVDYKTTVYVNGSSVKTHTGGFSAFSVDVTNYLNGGENTLLVKVIDATDEATQPVGKQRTDSDQDSWHSAVTGIWQTVWIEPVDSKYISDIVTTADVDNSTLTVTPETSGTESGDIVKAVLSFDGEIVAEGSAEAGSAIELAVSDPQLWTPYAPNLYDLTLSLVSGDETTDEVTSYAAMRKISVAADADGIYRIQLNNEDFFQLGVIDQGYWPDGLYTAPTDAALVYDIKLAKNLNFNTIRKHMKVEPARWYYHADRLGVLVWQDMPALKDDGDIWTSDEWFTGTENKPAAAARSTFTTQWKEIVNQLKSNPSIAVWTPFNEGWGQFTTSSVVSTTEKQDDTRLIDAASGGNHLEGVGDVLDIHDYTTSPTIYFYDSTRPTVMGQYGGLTLYTDDHVWDADYTDADYTDTDDLTTAYVSLTNTIEALAQGSDGEAISAAIYTQIVDVENELSGLFTYDRRQLKVDNEKVRAVNNLLLSDVLTSIDGVTATADNVVEVARYNVSGQRVPASAKGVVIVRYSDGSARKLIMR